MYMLLIEGTCAPKSMPKAAGVMLGVGDRLGRLYWVQLARTVARKPWITVTPCAQYWGMSIPIVEAYLGVLTCLTTSTMALTLTVTLTLALTLTLTLTLTLIYTHGRYTTAVTLTHLYLLT